MENEKFEKWLNECPFPIVLLDEGEFEMKVIARFVCSSSHVYGENTHVVMSLDNLKKIVEGEKKWKNSKKN